MVDRRSPPRASDALVNDVSRSAPHAVIIGAFEHPRRVIPDRSIAQIHREVIAGALADAHLTLSDVDGFFCDGTAPGFGPVSLMEFLGLRCRYVDSTELGGATYIAHLGRAAAAIAHGECDVAVVTLAGRPRSGGAPPGAGAGVDAPERPFEDVGMKTAVPNYALAARRHMWEFGTTNEDLAWIKVAASEHASHNPCAFLPDPVSVDDVLASPLVADPLHRLDCCVVTDGGGALVLARNDIARTTGRTAVSILGCATAMRHGITNVDITESAGCESGGRAFGQAGVRPSDINYASLYDSFTITVLLAIEDLGFCKKGFGGGFVSDGGLRSPGGALPFNTDGGGLSNNHPGNRGGMTKVIEAVRQLRGEAHPTLQVPQCEVAVAHGVGGLIATRHVAATAVLARVS